MSNFLIHFKISVEFFYSKREKISIININNLKLIIQLLKIEKLINTP